MEAAGAQLPVFTQEKNHFRRQLQLSLGEDNYHITPLTYLSISCFNPFIIRQNKITDHLFPFLSKYSPHKEGLYT